MDGNKGYDNPGLEHTESEASITNLSDDSYMTVEVTDGDKTYPVERKNSMKKQKVENFNLESQEPSSGKFCHVGTGIAFLYTLVGGFVERHSAFFRGAIVVIFSGLYIAYLGGAIYYSVTTDAPVDFCNGVELLYILTSLAILGIGYFKVVKPLFGETIYRCVFKPVGRIFDKVWSIRFVPLIFCLVLVAGIITFLVIDAAEQYERLISAFGLCVILLLGWLFSAHPGHVRWRHVIWGLSLQFIFALIILRWDVGRDIFQCLGDKVSTFLSYTSAGSGFVYGWLATGQDLTTSIEPNLFNQTVSIVPGRLSDIFAFGVLSVVFFFSFFINILYYFGVMQFVVMKLGWLLQVSIGTTAAESMNAAANIFLGQTEAPLLIKPYIGVMTKSELHAVMTGGFATIAGSVLAAYISFGIDAANLIAASVMAAPAALAFSKLFYPETEESKTKSGDIVLEKGKEANALDAAAQGASNAVFLVMNIIANLIAFLAFVAFLNGVISWFAGLVGAPYITFEWIISKIFIPVAWLLGVHWSECEIVGQLIAIKTIVNEFAAFGKLAEFKSKGMISQRGESIVTYALCGFANPGSIGAQIAALSTLSPPRQSDLASIAFRAFVAGATASLLNACIAGMLITAPGPLDTVVNSTSFLY